MRAPTFPFSMRMAMKTLLRRLLPLTAPATLVLAAGCGGDETQAPADDHTPVRYSLLIDGVEATPPFNLTAGDTVNVRIKFFNAADEDLDAVESSHFAGLTFTPSSLAAAERDPTHHFQFEVAPDAPGNGSVVVSYGHDEQADETSFPAAVVIVHAP